jgi:hypothetical protein
MRAIVVSRRQISTLLALLISATVFSTLQVAPSNAASFLKSQTIALVPDAGGRTNNGGSFPTTGFPGGYAPSFSDVSLEDIRDAATNPIDSAFDTVVLNSVCDIGAFLADVQFKSRIESFVSNGGKLIIWDSECLNTDYSKFALPFQTNNPGQLGAQGTLTDVEDNTLSSANPSSPYYVDDAAVASQTDAVGDANVFTTFDPRWFVDLRAKNASGVDGPAQAYANLGQGLVIYSGLDKDFLPGASFDPAATNGASHLNRIWLLELLQPWNPDNLPHDNPVVGGRYVALGDSVPYGHGLANPGTKPQDGLPPNQGPAAESYPVVLAKELGLSLKVRPSGCVLENDHLAVSGASSSFSNTETPDSDCPQGPKGRETPPHKAVNPDELLAANLRRDPAKLVTIQAGANDVDFDGCLTWELGLRRRIPFTGLRPEKCVEGTGKNLRLSNNTLDELKILQLSLDRIVKYIERNSPDAKIAVFNYFQIIPKPSTPVTKDGSYICNVLSTRDPNYKDLRANIYNHAALLQSKLNEVISNVVNSNPGVILVDISKVFEGKEMCTQESRVFHGLWRAAHPTAQGHADIAAAAHQALAP